MVNAKTEFQHTYQSHGIADHGIHDVVMFFVHTEEHMTFEFR